MSVTVERDEGTAIVKIDSPPVNALSRDVRAGLIEAFENIADDASISGIVLATQGKVFIGGADIREFGQEPKKPYLSEAMDAIENCSVATVAAIQGTALGGGMEVALACRYRVCSYAAKLSFPEVSLGLIPDAGETQRLSRLIGVEKAASLIATGTSVTAEIALVDGLVDAIAFEDTIKTAKLFINKVITDGSYRKI